MQQNSQFSSGFRQARARNYDTYVPPGGGQAVPVQTQGYSQSYAPQPQPQQQPQPVQQHFVPQQQYVQQQHIPVKIGTHQQHSASSLDFIQQSYTQPAKQLHTAKPVVKPIASHKKQPKRIKRSLFSAIVKASFEVEKVTKQSMKAVKHTFEPPELIAQRTKRQKLVHRTFYVVGTASFVMAIGLGAKLMFGQPPQPQRANTGVLSAQVATQNDASRQTELPSEQKPTKQDIDTYLVAQPYPRYLRVPSLGIESRIRRLGLDSKGAVGSPNNIFDIGWYDGSVRPGEKDGSSVLVGHVAGPSQQGVFWGLVKIETGAIIEIEKGNGESIRYAVTKIDKLPAGDIDMRQYIASDPSGRHSLRLISSAGGKYATLSEQFTGRVVITALQQ